MKRHQTLGVAPKVMLNKEACVPHSRSGIRGRRLLVAAFCWTAGLCACSYYSLTSSLPAHIKTVAVPLFEDRVFEYGIAEQMTDAVIAAFVQDHTLKVVDEQGADSVLQGTVMSVQDEAMTYTADEDVQERKITIRVDVSYYDSRKKKVIWEKEGIEEWGSYDPSDPSSREEGINEAIGELAREMINLTLSDW